MPYLKQGSQFLYDNTTGDIVGVRDDDGGDQYFASFAHQPRSYGSLAPISIVAVAGTFGAGSISDDGSGNVLITGAGNHGLNNSPAQGKSVFVSWAGGTGVDGLYEVLDVSTASDEIIIDLAYDAGLGTPTVSPVNADIEITRYTVPASVLAVGMSMELNCLFSCTGSGNNKTAKVNFGTAAWYAQTVAGSIQSICVQKTACANAVDTLLSNALAAPGHGTSTGANLTMTPSGGFASSQVLQFVGSLSTANEFITLESWKLKINGA